MKQGRNKYTTTNEKQTPILLDRNNEKKASCQGKDTTLQLKKKNQTNN